MAGDAVDDVMRARNGLVVLSLPLLGTPDSCISFFIFCTNIFSRRIDKLFSVVSDVFALISVVSDVKIKINVAADEFLSCLTEIATLNSSVGRTVHTYLLETS